MRILTALGRIARPEKPDAAETLYRTATRLAYRAQGRLSQPLTGRTRVAVLGELAALDDQLSRLHPQVFGPDPNPHENGRDLSESLRLSGLLLSLLADTEYAATTGVARWMTDTELEPHAGPVLNRMAATADAEARGRMLDDLYDAVVDHVGGQAAETIGCLPAPGRNIAITLRDHLDMLVPRWALEVAWSVLLLTAATVAALLVDHHQVGVATAVAAALTVGAVAPTRPTGVPLTAAALFAAAYGLLAGATVHHVGPQGLIVAVVFTLVAPAMVLVRRTNRRR